MFISHDAFYLLKISIRIQIIQETSFTVPVRVIVLDMVRIIFISYEQDTSEDFLYLIQNLPCWRSIFVLVLSAPRTNETMKLRNKKQR